jgi:hypothetical protein
MRAWLWFSLVALGGCGGVTASPSDGGAADVVQASVDAGVDTGADATFDAGPPDHAAPTDAPPADAPLPDDSGCDLGVPLAAPTFTPPDGTSLQAGDQVTINPPAGFPGGAAIYFTTNGTIPTHSSSVYIGPIQVDAPETIFAMAGPVPGYCFADSPVVHASYTISKPSQDACVGSWPPFPPTPPMTRPFTVTTFLCPGDTLCYRYDGNTPTCSNGTCTGGSLTYDTTKGIPIGPTVTDPTTGKVTLTAVACDAQGDVSNVVTQVFQLVQAPPYLASANPDGAGLPGWDWSHSGLPVTTMAIPADAGAPYGPFVAQQVGSPPCTSATSCKGTPNAVADHLCWSKGPSTTCLCPNPIPLTSATPYATLPAAANVGPGDTLSIIACAQGYLNTMTTVQF